MRPSSCPLRNSLKEERHLKCLRGSNVSFGLQQGQGTGTANFLLIRKFLSKQISDTANGTEITEGANWQEILKIMCHLRINHPLKMACYQALVHWSSRILTRSWANTNKCIFQDKKSTFLSLTNLWIPGTHIVTERQFRFTEEGKRILHVFFEMWAPSLWHFDFFLVFKLLCNLLPHLRHALSYPQF